MNYNSTCQIAQNLATSLGYTITSKKVQQVLRQLDCIDEYNEPTVRAIANNLYKIGYFKGREYLKWNEEVEREIYEILLDRSNKK